MGQATHPSSAPETEFPALYIKKLPDLPELRGVFAKRDRNMQCGIGLRLANNQLYSNLRKKNSLPYRVSQGKENSM